MIRRLFASALLTVALSVSVPSYAASPAAPAMVIAAAQIPLFASEAAAQAHCPKDVVVWLNIPSGIYHEKGMRWYGRTKHGAFVCRKEADAAGYRDTENGQ
jgi:hypothetical protein